MSAEQALQLVKLLGSWLETLLTASRRREQGREQGGESRAGSRAESATADHAAAAHVPGASKALEGQCITHNPRPQTLKHAVVPQALPAWGPARIGGSSCACFR